MEKQTKHTLDLYRETMKELAIEFELHIDPEFEEQFLGHFPGDDYGIYCDTSEFYSWTPSEMYLILKENIPYDIATEHQNISINEMWKDMPHYNLKTYWEYRKVNLDMNFEDYFMFLQRHYHLGRARVHTKEFKEETDTLMQKLKDDYLKNVNS